MWCLFCHHLFFISTSFGASGMLCFVIVTFPGYLQLYLHNRNHAFNSDAAQNYKLCVRFTDGPLPQ